MNRIFISTIENADPKNARERAVEAYIRFNKRRRAIDSMALTDGFIERYKNEMNIIPNRRDILNMRFIAMLSCDSIYMFRGWENDREARAEQAIAVALGMKIIYEMPK